MSKKTSTSNTSGFESNIVNTSESENELKW